jgi:parvulin-like peptidyl-prolyl isomerase
MRPILPACLCLLTSALIAAGCGSSGSAPSPAQSVCSVNGNPITLSLVKRLQAQTTRSYKSGGKKMPAAGTQAGKQINLQIIQTLVQQQLLSEIATEQHVAVTDKQVDAGIDKLVKTTFGGDRARYMSEVAKQGLDVATVRDNVREQLLNEAVFNALGKGFTPSEQQIKAAYQSSRAEVYHVKATRTVAHILLSSEKQAAKIRAQAAAHPEDARLFASLAKQYSTDRTTSSIGGELTITQGETTAAFDTAAFALATGQISKVVHTEYGYHVIRAIGPIVAAHFQPLSEVRPQVITSVRQTHQAQLLQAELQVKESKAKVSCHSPYNWQAPKAAPAPQATSAAATAARAKS